MRYHLHDHPAFPGLLSKEDLYSLVDRGSLARGDLCLDTLTQRNHTVGDIIHDMPPPSARSIARVNRPAYQEIRADADFLDEVAEAPETDEGETLEPDSELDPEDSVDASLYTPAGELILHKSHPSWLLYWKPLLLSLLLLVAAGLLSQIEMEFAIACLLLGLAFFVITWIARASRDYLVTEERVELIWGILGRSSKEVRICDIRSMDVYESGLKGLLGLGTVDFSSAANAGIEVQFKDMRRSHEVKELVRQLQRSAETSEP